MAAPPSGPSGIGTSVLTAEAFARHLDELGPLEPEPVLAVAVSGGPDSLALAYLAHDVVSARGGRVAAVTVDHGLRDDSAEEASRVSHWLRNAGIGHTILQWRGERPRSNLQAVARRARYALLDRFCRERGILHLLTAHHADDQRETQVLRLARKAGPGGLAGMSAIESLEHCQVLRPLLAVPRDSLAAALRARNLSWVEDPSNSDRRFDRVRVRAGLTLAGSADLSLLTDMRRREEERVAQLLAWTVGVDVFGAATVSRPHFIDADDDVAAQALGAILATIGGGEYPPRRERTARLLEDWRENSAIRGRTLGGCRIAAGPGGRLSISREAGRISHTCALEAAGESLWDGRFRLRVSTPSAGFSVSRLTDVAWRRCRTALPWVAGSGPAPAVRRGLPAVYRDGEIAGVPSLDAWLHQPSGPCRGPVSATFAPQRALTRATFVAATNLV